MNFGFYKKLKINKIMLIQSKSCVFSSKSLLLKMTFISKISQIFKIFALNRHRLYKDWRWIQNL